MPRDVGPYLAQTERLLYLRTVDAFSELPASQLAALAEQTRERLFEPGETLIAPGKRSRRLFMVVEGQVRLALDGHTVGHAGPRGGVAALAVLAQRPVPISAVAESETLTLELERALLVELLSDNFSMLQSVLRRLARGLLNNRRRLGLHAGYDHRPEPGLECPAGPLDLVQRLGFLRRALPFAGDQLAALVDLARHAEEVRHEPGTIVWRQGDRSGWTDLIYCGTVGADADEGRQRFYFHDSSAVGAIDDLAGEPRWYSATAESRVIALRITVEHLLDLFEDRFEIAHAFLRMIATELLDVLALRGSLEGLTGDGPLFERTDFIPGESTRESE